MVPRGRDPPRQAQGHSSSLRAAATRRAARSRRLIHSQGRPNRGQLFGPTRRPGPVPTSMQVVVEAIQDNVVALDPVKRSAGHTPGPCEEQEPGLQLPLGNGGGLVSERRPAPPARRLSKALGVQGAARSRQWSIDRLSGCYERAQVGIERRVGLDQVDARSVGEVGTQSVADGVGHMAAWPMPPKVGVGRPRGLLGQR